MNKTPTLDFKKCSELQLLCHYVHKCNLDAPMILPFKGMDLTVDPLSQIRACIQFEFRCHTGNMHRR